MESLLRPNMTTIQVEPPDSSSAASDYADKGGGDKVVSAAAIANSKYNNSAANSVSITSTFTAARSALGYPFHRVNGSQKPQRERMVTKRGVVHIEVTHKRRTRCLGACADLFTTVLDLQWIYVIAFFVFSFVLSWVVFALFWLALVTTDSEERPCVTSVYDFRTALLFSIETQHTIGYGSRYVTENCAVGVFLVMLQSIIGLLISGMVTGMILAKVSRPVNRGRSMLFSKKACIYRRNGYHCLLIRLADLRVESQLIQVQIRGILLQERLTPEGEPIAKHQTELFFVNAPVLIDWPVTMEHRIDENSPLWTLSKRALDQAEDSALEIVIVVEAVNETTGFCTQIRTSYLPSETVWGATFEVIRPVFKVKDRGCGYNEIDYQAFNRTVTRPDFTPLSAMQYADAGLDDSHGTGKFTVNAVNTLASA